MISAHNTADANETLTNTSSKQQFTFVLCVWCCPSIVSEARFLMCSVRQCVSGTDKSFSTESQTEDSNDSKPSLGLILSLGWSFYGQLLDESDVHVQLPFSARQDTASRYSYS